MKLLGMPKASVIDVSVNNENIRFSAKDVKRGLSCFNWLVDKIGTEQEQTPKTIVFCRSINDVSVVLSYLLKKLGHLAYIDENKSKTKCLLGVYHSNSPAELKERVRKSFKNDDGPIRVVIATSALSLGVNFKDIRYVIHYGPAPDLRSHLQEAGRAGRDGKEAHNITFYHGQQLRLCDKKIKACLNRHLPSSGPFQGFCARHTISPRRASLLPQLPQNVQVWWQQMQCSVASI